jgi:hypothetical protein
VITGLAMVGAMPMATNQRREPESPPRLPLSRQQSTLRPIFALGGLLLLPQSDSGQGAG